MDKKINNLQNHLHLLKNDSLQDVLKRQIIQEVVNLNLLIVY